MGKNQWIREIMCSSGVQPRVEKKRIKYDSISYTLYHTFILSVKSK